MKSKLATLIFLLAVFYSCKKITNIEVTSPTSGEFTYKLLDDAGKGISNVKVSVFDRLEGRPVLYESLTDNNGVADFGKINSGSYFIRADSPAVNNIKYSIQEYVQVLTGKPKHKEIKVSDYSGTLNITIINHNYYNPLKNIGVLVIPTNRFTYDLPTTSYFGVADYKGVSDAKGFVSFKVPSNKEYTLYLYNITTNVRYDWPGTFSIQKGSTTNLSLYIYGEQPGN
ncbi:hypothetical protein D3C71_1330950 [compost metagenome]